MERKLQFRQTGPLCQAGPGRPQRVTSGRMEDPAACGQGSVDLSTVTKPQVPENLTFNKFLVKFQQCLLF